MLAFGSMMEEPSVSVFLSGTYPEKEQAEEIVKTLEQTEAETSACFYWDGGMTTLTEPDYGRSAQVMAAGILGDGSLYDKRIRGFWEKDKEGCIIDGDTAWKLFWHQRGRGTPACIRGKNLSGPSGASLEAEDDPDPSGERRNRVYQSISEK